MTRRLGHQRSSFASLLGRTLARFLLKLAGWRVDPVPDIGKAVFVGGPHTSNWDGVIGIIAAIAIELKPTIFVKEQAFRWPLDMVLRRVGGVPIDRSRSGGVVAQAVDEFTQHDRLLIVVTPEGTRKSAPKWKSGCYHIARQAGVPMIVALINYADKTITFPLILQPSEDVDADMQKMIECFADTTPRRPENLSAPVKTARARRHPGTT